MVCCVLCVVCCVLCVACCVSNIALISSLKRPSYRTGLPPIFSKIFLCECQEQWCVFCVVCFVLCVACCVLCVEHCLYFINFVAFTQDRTPTNFSQGLSRTHVCVNMYAYTCMRAHVCAHMYACTVLCVGLHLRAFWRHFGVHLRHFGAMLGHLGAETNGSESFSACCDVVFSVYSSKDLPDTSIFNSAPANNYLLPFF